jgi:hypothetical protein
MGEALPPPDDETLDPRAQAAKPHDAMLEQDKENDASLRHKIQAITQQFRHTLDTLTAEQHARSLGGEYERAADIGRQIGQIRLKSCVAIDFHLERLAAVHAAMQVHLHDRAEALAATDAPAEE